VAGWRAFPDEKNDHDKLSREVAMRPYSQVPRLLAVMGLAAGLAGVAQAAAQTAQVKVASTVKEIFDNLPLFVASQGGMFKKHGLDVEVAHFAGGGEVVRAVSSGSMQIGMVGTSAAMLAAGRGQNLKILSSWSAPAFGILWIVPTDSPLKTVKQLDGKKIGITRPGSVSHTGIVAALQANGIKADIVPVGGPGDSWAALKNDRVQASWHTVPDVYSLVDRGDARILFQISDYLTEYQQGSLVAMGGYLSQNGETVRKFLAASAEAVAFINEKPEEAAKMGANATGLPEKLVLRTIREMPKDFFRIGAPRPEDFKGSLNEALAAAPELKAPSYDVMVDRSFLPATAR
jgi:NitT/TauT family transport system substrate-binding protein